jgi:hypothetical protein
MLHTSAATVDQFYQYMFQIGGYVLLGAVIGLVIVLFLWANGR